jgi:hypothetical protein
MISKKPVKELKRQLLLAYESQLIETYLVKEDAQIDIFPQDKYESYIIFKFKEQTPIEVRQKLIKYIEDTFDSVLVSPKNGMEIIWIDYKWTL